MGNMGESNTRLERDVTNLNTENQKLQNIIEQNKDRINPEVAEKLQNQLTQLQINSDRILQQNTQLQNERNELQNKLNNLVFQSEQLRNNETNLNSNNTKLTNKLQEEERKLIAKQKEVDDTERAFGGMSNENKILRDSNERLDNENRRLLDNQGNLDRNGREAIRNLNSRIDFLKRERIDINKQLSDLRRQIRDINSENQQNVRDLNIRNEAEIENNQRNSSIRNNNLLRNNRDLQRQLRERNLLINQTSEIEEEILTNVEIDDFVDEEIIQTEEDEGISPEPELELERKEDNEEPKLRLSEISFDKKNIMRGNNLERLINEIIQISDNDMERIVKIGLNKIGGDKNDMKKVKLSRNKGREFVKLLDAGDDDKIDKFIDDNNMSTKEVAILENVLKRFRINIGLTKFKRATNKIQKRNALDKMTKLMGFTPIFDILEEN